MHRSTLLAVPLLLAVLATPVLAHGRMLASDRRLRPPATRPGQYAIHLTQTEIAAKVKDRVAAVEISEHFHNPHPQALEGEYVFPLPPNASLGRFSMTVGGKEMKGELLERGKARGIYESIVRRRQDPGLLEFLDWGLFRARVFPVPPRGTVVVKISYETVLERDGELTMLRQTLGGETATIRVALETTQPLKALYSPSHSVKVTRPDDHHATVSLESRVPQGGNAFRLYYTTDARPFGLSILTHRVDGEPGYFLAMVNPKVEFDRKNVDPRDVVLVLDTSGSMQGEKIRQARQALRFCLRGLDPRDRFNVICFASAARSFRRALVTASPKNVEAALRFVSGQDAVGGTNIHDALNTAVRLLDDEKRLGITLFLTDGCPTQGGNEATTLSMMRAADRRQNRLFVFGVGNDVNTRFLDTLAEEHRGARTYVRHGESIEDKVSRLYQKVQHPVLSDLDLRFEDLTSTDVYPRRLPDLFKGSQLLVVGRYTETGRKTVRLHGKNTGQDHRFVYEADFPAINERNAFLPRLWATRKVGSLLDILRLQGNNKEIVDSVITLGKKYGIVTPYTSYLVVEDDARLAANDLSRVHGALNGLRDGQAAATARGDAVLGQQTGAGATNVSQGTNQLRSFAGGWAGPSGHAVTRRGGSRYAGPSGSAPPNMQPPGTPTPPPGAGPLPTPTPTPTPGLARGSAISDTAEFFMGRRTSRTARRPVTVGHQHRRAGGHVFLRVGSIWVDTLYQPKSMAKNLIKIEAFSRAYFDLLTKHKDLAKLLAVGPNCIVVLKGQAYHVHPRPPAKKKKSKK